MGLHVTQPLPEFRDGSRPLRGIFRHRPVQCLNKSRRDGDVRGQRRHRLVDNAGEQRDQRFFLVGRFEGWAPGQQRVHRRTKRVGIARTGGWAPFKNLGRRVYQSGRDLHARCLKGARLPRDPEVGEKRFAELRHQHVCWLDISMNNPDLMRSRQRAREFHAYAKNVGGAQRATLIESVL